MIAEDIRRYYKAVSPEWAPLPTLNEEQHLFIKQALESDLPQATLRAIEYMLDEAVHKHMEARDEEAETEAEPGS